MSQAVTQIKELHRDLTCSDKHQIFKDLDSKRRTHRVVNPSCLLAEVL